MSPEQLQDIVDRLPVAASLRDIARDTGIEVSKVRNAARPFIILMQASGTLPPCECGKPRFHMYGCTRTLDARVKPGRRRGDVQRQDMIIGLMLDGVPITRIAQMLGMQRCDVRRHKRFMTPEQRQRFSIIAQANQLLLVPVEMDAGITEALVNGASYREIPNGNQRITKHLRALSPDQRRRREAAIAQRQIANRKEAA